MNYGVIRKYKKNEIIFREGEMASCIFELRWGSVGLFTDYGTENERLVTSIEGEGCIGAFAVFDKAGYKATAVSLERGTQLELISSEDFHDFFSSRPAKLLSITQSLCHLHRKVVLSYSKACKRIVELEKAIEEKESEGGDGKQSI